MVWTIQTTNVQVIPANGHPRLVRGVAGGTGTVSYWDTPGLATVATPLYNDYHFTLGGINGGTAYFHATWHAQNCVRHFQCSVDQHGALTVTGINHAHNNNINQVTLGEATNFAQAAYQAVEVKDEAEKKQKEAINARERKAFKGNTYFRNVLGIKPVNMKPSRSRTTRRTTRTN
jgi:hypothetical protein